MLDTVQTTSPDDDVLAEAMKPTNFQKAVNNWVPHDIALKVPGSRWRMASQWKLSLSAARSIRSPFICGVKMAWR